MTVATGIHQEVHSLTTLVSRFRFKLKYVTSSRRTHRRYIFSFNRCKHGAAIAG